MLSIVKEVPDTFGDIPEDWHFYDPDTGEELKAVDMMRDVMKVACAMIVLPETVAAEVLKINAAMIADADLAGKGREDQPHITVKYGVREDLGQTAEALVEFYPFEVTLGKTKIFEPSANSKGAAVVVVEVIAPILQQLHDKINDSIGLRHDGADYVPHVTLAYVDAAEADKYDGRTDLEGVKFTASAVTIKRVNKKEWTFDLGGSRLVSKAGEDEEDEEVEEIILDILQGFEEIVPAMEHELASTHLDSATEMRDALDVESSIQFSVLNEKALQYARKRAAEMVGKKWVDGELVDNPNAVWAITETTRDVLRTLIDDAFGQGQTPAELATSIERTGIFGAWRADLIASTEMARATRQGARDTAKEVGVIGKSSETSGDHTEENCDGSCDEAEDRGVIAIDEDYGVTGHWDGPGCILGNAMVAAANIAALTTRSFHGEIVRIRIEGDDDLGITPNHPILTSDGWIPAGEVKKGTKLAHSVIPEVFIRAIDPDDYLVPSVFEKVADALLPLGAVSVGSMPHAAEDFHGDGIVDGEVDVVLTAGFLKDRSNVALGQGGCERSFGLGHVWRELLHCYCSLPSLDQRDNTPPDGRVSSGGEIRPSGLAEFRHSQDRSFFAGSDMKVESFELLTQGAARDMIFMPQHDSGDAASVLVMDSDGLVVRKSPSLEVGPAFLRRGLTSDRQIEASESNLDAADGAFGGAAYLLQCLSSLVEFIELTDDPIREAFSGQVFNLETKHGFYLANGIIVSNCNCVEVFYTADDPEAADLLEPEEVA